MTLEINEEAIAYINGISSQKKKQTVLLNIMLDQIEKIAIVKISDLPSKTYSDSEAVTLDKKPNMFDWYKGEFNNKSAKPNYSKEEIELVKSNVAERKVTEQASELLNNHINEIESSLRALSISRFKNIAKGALEAEDLSLDTCILYKNKSVINGLYDLASKFRAKEKELIEREKPQGELLKFDQIDKEDIKLQLEKAFDSARKENNDFNLSISSERIMEFATFEDYYKTLKK
jgi:hypothetical protein